MHACRIGKLRLVVLDDGSFPFSARLFFRGVPEAAWRPGIAADADGNIVVGHNHGLVDTGRELVVIDTGYGDDTHGGRAGHLLEDFTRTGYRREQVRTVVLTHAHGDHIKRNTLMQDGQRRPTFPRARYLLARADHDWFGGEHRAVEFDEQIFALEQFGVLDLFEGEVRLAPEIALLPTPGHTPGHTSVLVESEGKSALFLGDVCHHPLHFAHPEWVSVFDTHPAITPRTREWLFRLAAERDALLVCPHAQTPGLGRLRRTVGGYSWQAVNE